MKLFISTDGIHFNISQTLAQSNVNSPALLWSGCRHCCCHHLLNVYFAGMIAMSLAAKLYLKCQGGGESTKIHVQVFQKRNPKLG